MILNQRIAECDLDLDERHGYFENALLLAQARRDRLRCAEIKQDYRGLDWSKYRRNLLILKNLRPPGSAIEATIARVASLAFTGLSEMRCALFGRFFAGFKSSARPDLKQLLIRAVKEDAPSTARGHVT